MGMYDYVELNVKCPICGNTIINTFQTKDFDCVMDTYHLGDKVPANCRFNYMRTYTTCDHRREITKIEDELIFILIMGYWIEYEIPIIDGIISSNQNLWKRRIEPMAYNVLSIAPEGYTEEQLYKMVERLNERIGKDIEVTKFENKNCNI